MWLLMLACAPVARLVVPDPMYTSDGQMLEGPRRWREGDVAEVGEWQLRLHDVTPVQVTRDAQAGEELKHTESAWKLDVVRGGNTLLVECREQAAVRLTRISDTLVLPSDQQHRLHCRLGADAELLLFGASLKDGRGYIRSGQRRFLLEPLRQMVDGELVDGFLLRESGRPVAAVEGGAGVWPPKDGDLGLTAGLFALVSAAGLAERRTE